MDIDFTRLRYFVAVADELHFKRAADRLMITPPPLSKQIKLLETELGGELFERNYHEVRLTPLGEHLLGPARTILQQVDEFKRAASTFTSSGMTVRIGATAYAPSDFLERFETAVAEQPVATSLEVQGSAAEVTAKLIAGSIELGLIQLPSTDRRIRRRIVGTYQGAVAVRADDPLADKELVHVDELRDRQVVVDLARPNPVMLAELTRALQRAGIHQIVRAVTGRGGELEIAQQVFNRRLVAVVPYAPKSFLGRLFSPPQFKLVPIDTGNWKPQAIALAWTAVGAKRVPELEQLVDELAAALDRTAEH
ncbi:LysR family transcriptional regulator [Nocardia sp. NPDC005825]|uniref:LysR family transcriptional regulator n=1 Tax=unclassified Nocardia TaxID=2637762 RepID=UPI0033D7D57F